MGRLTVRKIDIYGNKYIATGGGAYFEEESVYKALEKLAHYEDLEEQGRLIEVVYGFNIQDHDSAFECSVCGFSDWDTLTADDSKYNYCPFCGAKMSKEEE